MSRSNPYDGLFAPTNPIGVTPVRQSPTLTTQSPRNRLMQSLMTPEAIAAIATGGLGVGSALLQNRSNQATSAADRRQRLGQDLAIVGGDQADDLRARQQGYLNSFAMNPVSQSRDLFSANILRELAGHGASQAGPGGVVNPFHPSSDAMGFLSSGALAENASRFYGAAGALNPYAQHPDLQAMGFGADGASRQGGLDANITDAAQRYEAINAQRRADLLAGAGASEGAQNIAPFPAPPQSHWEMGSNGQPHLVAGETGNRGLDPSQAQHQGTSAKRKFLGVLGAVGAGIGGFFTGGATWGAVGPSLQYGFQPGSGKQALVNGAMGVGLGMAGNQMSNGDYFNRGKA